MEDSTRLILCREVSQLRRERDRLHLEIEQADCEHRAATNKSIAVQKKMSGLLQDLGLTEHAAIEIYDTTP